MITFDQFRSALLDTEPHAALDRPVRGELDAGRKTAEVYDELLGHVDALRLTPGYTDEIEDVLGDTMDALCEWVHPSCAYQDPADPPATPPGVTPGAEPHVTTPSASTSSGPTSR